MFKPSTLTVLYVVAVVDEAFELADSAACAAAAIRQVNTAKAMRRPDLSASLQDGMAVAFLTSIPQDVPRQRSRRPRDQLEVRRRLSQCGHTAEFIVLAVCRASPFVCRRNPIEALPCASCTRTQVRRVDKSEACPPTSRDNVDGWHSAMRLCPPTDCGG